MTIFSMYGGGFATIPAYLADIFGTKYVGGIHGRLLTAWSCAGIIGPGLLTTLRKNSEIKAINELTQQVDPLQSIFYPFTCKIKVNCGFKKLTTTVFFEQTFKASKDELNELINAKTVTINRLMDIVPENVMDPTPTLYDTTMYSMAGLLGVALLANGFMRPIYSFHDRTHKVDVDQQTKIAQLKKDNPKVLAKSIKSNSKLKKTKKIHG